MNHVNTERTTMTKTQAGRLGENDAELNADAYAHRDVIKWEFATQLRRHLLSRNWSQTDLANAAAKKMPDGKFGRYLISGYVNAQYLPHPLNLAAMAAALKVKTEDLLPQGGSNLPKRGEATPPQDLRVLGDGRASLRINQVVTMELALKILQLLNESTKKER
jgi:transcriptional regulator with XRE-family HTH domain